MSDVNASVNDNNETTYTFDDNYDVYFTIGMDDGEPTPYTVNKTWLNEE